MKKSFLSILIVVMITMLSCVVFVACQNDAEENSIVHDSNIESRWGDAYADIASTSAPYSAVECTSLPRVTRRIIIDGRIKGRHVLGLYAPKGEQVVYSIDSAELSNNHKLAFNANCTISEVPVDNVSFTGAETKLTRKSCGAMIELDVKEGAADSFVVTVSGAVVLPTYRYGIDSSESFRNDLNYNVLDCTNLRVYVPGSECGRINNAKMAMNWWRNALIRMDSLYELSFFNEDYSPFCVYFRQSVEPEDIISVENNCIFLPYSFIDSFVNYDKIIAGDGGNVLQVLKYIALEKKQIDDGFSDTFLADTIQDILAELTYIEMVDSSKAMSDEVDYDLTASGNVQEILFGEINTDQEKYTALFTNMFYSVETRVIELVLETIRKDKTDESQCVAQFAILGNLNLIDLADKLSIPLYGESITQMEGYDPYYLVANKYTYSRNSTKVQSGITVKIGVPTKIDFASAIVGDADWEISALNGAQWSKDEDGYVYTPTKDVLTDTFELVLTKGEHEVKLYGNITVDITVSECKFYNNVTFKSLDEAVKGVKDLTVSETMALDRALIPQDAEMSDAKVFAVASGAFEVDSDGIYQLYLRSSGLCKVTFGVMDYFSEIFNNSLTVSSYTDELMYEVKLQKGFKYIYTIYNLYNQGSGFAELGISKSDSNDITPIDKKYLINPQLTRNDIVEYVPVQNETSIMNQQNEEYQTLESTNIAQLVNLPSYSIGEESVVIEKNSKVSFVLPFKTTGTVSYVRIKTQDMNGVKIRILSGVNNDQEVGSLSLSDGVQVAIFEERNVSNLKLEFTSSNDYKLHILELDAGKYISPMTIVPSTSPDIEYIGEWKSSDDYVAINGRLAVSGSKDAVISYAFNGTEISIYATIGPEFGAAKITIDGQEKGSIDLNNSKIVCSQLVYTQKLKPGDHTIKITAADESSINYDYLAVSSFGESTSQNDFSKLWYISIIPGVVLVVGIIFVSLDIREKQKKKKEIQE